MTLLLAVTTTLTAWAQNTLQFNLDYCKAGICSICIAGWVYDSDPNTKLSWELGHGIEAFAFVSTDPNEVYEGYFPIPHDDMEYIVRDDVNAAFGLTGYHSFKTMISLSPYFYLFQDDEGDISEQTFYVKIYVRANFGNGYKNYLKHSTSVIVRRNFGEGFEENPYFITDAGDWNCIADVLADKDINEYFKGCYYQMDECYEDETPVTKMFGNADDPFDGHFDGNGRTLNVQLNGTEHVAPFAYTQDATIKNLTIAGTINATQSAGGIVGYAKNTLTLKNNVCAATISGFQNYASGLLGWCDDLTMNLQNSLFKGAFSPGSGGKYHPIALKDAEKTVTMPPVFDVYYVNTAAPSEGIDNNCIPKAKGFPVSATLDAGVWDDPFVAADGQTYYGVHFTGKHLPYEYGFETPLEEDGWTMVENYYKTGFSTDRSYRGHYDFMFTYHGNPQDNHNQYLISPEFDGHSGIKVVFYYQQFLGAYSATFQVGYSTTTPDIDAFNWDNGTTTNIKQWLLYEGNFPKGTKYIAVKWNPNYMGDLLLDDFCFTVCNAPSPTLLCVGDELTEYTASLTWEAPEADETITGYTYQYKKANEADWSAETTVDATSVTLTGLTANTDYQFRVKALYGEEESVYVPVSFTTAMELPYEYGFENGMNRWSRVDDQWGHTEIKEEAKHEGEKGYYFSWSTTSSPQYLISPRFAGTQPLTVSFYYKDRKPDSGFWETFYVGYSTTTSDLNAFQWSEAIYATNIPWTRYEQTFPVGTKFIAVKYTSSYTSGLYVDDFSFSEYSAFPKPTDLTIIDLTDTEATIGWLPPEADVTGFTYQYRKSTDDEWSAETTIYTNIVTLSNLTENTTYNFRVKALGSGGTASNYVTTSFLTDGSVVSLPYTDSFENGMGGWRMYDCHQNTEIKTIYAHSGEHCFYFHTNIEKNQYLLSPHFAGGTPMKMSFYYKNYDSNHPASFMVGYGSSKIAEITWQRALKATDGEWTLYEDFLPAETQYVVICRLKDTYMLHLDDFSFTALPEIDLADQANNRLSINDNKDKEVQVTLQDRTLHRDSYWQTLCLPFSLESFSGTPLSGATVKTLSSTSFSNGTLTLNFEDANSIEAGKPYLVNWEKAAYLTLYSEEDWNAFAESVNNGKSYAGKTVMLSTSINISTMVGTAEHPFDGIFDGNSKRLTINISNGGNGAAPFRYINGATIKNVGTVGTISGGNHSAGLVGFASGTNIIHNCLVETDVNVSTCGGEYVGGILGHGTSSTTTIRDCLCNCDLDGLYIGMIYGWGDAGGTHTIENCMVEGYYTHGHTTYQTDLMLLAQGGTCNVINCYKNQEIGTQGTYLFIVGDQSQLKALLGDQWTLDGNGLLAVEKRDHTTEGYRNGINPIFLGVTISDATAPVKTSYVDFIGFTSPVTFNANDPSVLYLDEDNMLHSPSANMTLGSCRAYFKLKGGGYDVNGDSHMDISDVTSLVNIILGKSTPEDKNTADLNGDGNVDISDVTTLVNAILGKISTDTPIKVRVVVSDGTGIVYEGQQP